MALFGIGYKKKIDELKKQLDAQDYKQAALVADEITVKHLKSAYELNLVGKAYKCNGDFLQAKDAFEYSYEMRKSRPVLLDILDCCLEIKDLENVEKYFDEYHKLSPEDKITQYKYRYRIEKKKGRECHLLITILEELKELDYIEEYSYELAKQYHKAGMAEKCMRECEEIILWFGFGPTVERAKALLAYYKGEINLENIKTGGIRPEEKYQAAGEANAAQEEWPQEKSVMAEYPEVTKEFITENTEEPAKEEAIESEKYEEQGPEAQSEEFVLPDIDMSDIFFDEDPIQGNELVQESTRMQEYELIQESEPIQEKESSAEKLKKSIPEEAESEYYIPAAEMAEPVNEILAELLRENQVSMLETLKNFGRIGRIQKQVVKSLELALDDREKSYFVIAGALHTGKTTLACYFIHLLYQLGLVKYERTAILDAVQLNQVSIEDYKEELKNCNLIIEHAAEMTRESVEGLLRFSQNSKRETCVILEDTVYSINKFLCMDKELNGLFNNRIYLSKKYNTEELFGFAYDYIKKEDYGIDKTAAQVLYDKIDEIVKNYDDEQRLTCTLKLVENIVSRMEKRVGEKIFAMAIEGKILQGNDFLITLEDITA